MKKRIRKTNNTILIAVEGYTEEAFVNYLKSYYCKRDSLVSVTVKNARGKGPDGIVDTIRSACSRGDYNLIGAVFDGDITPSAPTLKWLEDNKVSLFVSSPAIEATLLSVLKSRIGRTTKECKDLLSAVAKGDATDRAFYEKHFPLALLESSRGSTARLNDLIIFMTRKA